MAESAAAQNGGDDAGLVRALGLWDSTLLVIGLVLGSAVFMVTGGPGGVASLVPAPGPMLGAWIAGGTARLFLGAGIVEGSSAESEWMETQLKARALLDALEVPR